MDTYITGQTIKRLREEKGITQAVLAERIGVSSKAVSKWETAKGLPDVSLIEPLSQALGVSIAELISGEPVVNRNISCNMLRSKFYVCPICGNVLHATGEAVLSCCGVSLSPLEAEEIDANHTVHRQKVEDEEFITIEHEMSKTHYISFVCYVTCDRVQLIKFYPEGNPETRIAFRGRGFFYIYCNRHGLMKMKV